MNRRLLVLSTLRRLSRYKARSIFMGLGIVVGVIATVVLLSLEVRLKDRFRSFLAEAYPSDGIVLFAGSGPMGEPARRNLSIDDVEAIAARTGLVEWDPLVVTDTREVRGPAGVVPIALVGSSERAARVRRRGVTAGRFLDASDVASRARVALVGATAAEKLVPGTSPIGERVFVDGIGFEIVGVLERRGADPHGNDQDDTLVVPYTTMQESMVRTTAIAGAMFRVPDRTRVEALSREMVEFLRSEHGIAPGQADDFSVFTSARMQGIFRRVFRTVELFAPALSATLFLISALVVLALQQIGVESRRREIGLRRAIGARQRDIRSQFVVEALAVSAIAALVGLLLAEAVVVLMAPLAAREFGMTAVSVLPIARPVAFGAALATGLVGALRPARRAARLDPIAALR